MKTATVITRLLVAALLVAAAFMMLPGVAWPATRHPVHVVTIEEMRFSPETLNVSVGDRIVWRNKDLVPHTATSDSPGFDSKSIAPGGSWTYRARKAGKFPYSCRFHPSMHAVLNVLPLSH